MKKFLFASALVLSVSAVSAEGDCCAKENAAACEAVEKSDVIANLYGELVKRSSRIDTDDEEQRNEIQDVLKEVKKIVDDCNDKVSASLEKYPALRDQLNLQGTLTLNISVDSDEEAAQ